MSRTREVKQAGKDFGDSLDMSTAPGGLQRIRSAFTIVSIAAVFFVITAALMFCHCTFAGGPLPTLRKTKPWQLLRVVGPILPNQGRDSERSARSAVSVAVADRRRWGAIAITLALAVLAVTPS